MQLGSAVSDFDRGSQLTDKVALVASSRAGSCAESAHQLARAGASVVICGLNASQGNETVAEIQRNGGRARFILTDVALGADVQATINETIATFGRLDILLNFASDDHERDGAFLEVSETTWDRITETTLKGMFLCCQYALPFLQQSGSGRIINLVEQTSSLQSRSVASICQGGVLAMTYVIAQQFSAQNVSVNLVWVTQPASLMPLVPFTLDILADLLEKVLYSPTTEETGHASQPFTTAAEAIAHIVNTADVLHGHALVVNTPS
jgi:NAD(P)-dependent dehydrogenase (short-subunit alcohol dehydrogenase family)